MRGSFIHRIFVLTKGATVATLRNLTITKMTNTLENLKNEAAKIGAAYEQTAIAYFNAENPHPAVVMKKEKLSKAHAAVLDAIAYLSAAESADAIHSR